MTTTYPGLLIGSGYQHESGGENEFKIGFFFDYVSGLPRIPGSSVKGMLKSCFPERRKKEQQAQKLVFIREMMETVSSQKLTDNQVFDLVEEVFEGSIKSNGENERITIYRRDRFLDGVISPFNHEKRKFLGSDYITPHKKPLQDPLPIMFLKGLPEIVFRFQFVLHDSVAVEGVTAGHKVALFKSLLLQFGIGAKTNVGYGQFNSNMPDQQFDAHAADANDVGDFQDPPQPQRNLSNDDIPIEAIDKLKSGEAFDGKVEEIDEENKKFIVAFKVEGVRNDCVVSRSRYKKGKERSSDLSLLNPGMPVKVRINSDFSYGNVLNCTILLNS